jgi:hypothetical protein
MAGYPLASTKNPSGSPTASPVYTGNFIPTIWAGKLVEKFYDATVLAGIANTDYDGEIKSHGDKVIIRTKPAIAITAYEAEMALSVERPSSSLVTLNIDKGFYFNTILDDVLETQADLDLMSLWADDASEQMKIKIDTEVLAAMPAGMSSDNVGATAGRLTSLIDLGVTTSPVQVVSRAPGASQVEIIDVITRLGQTLDEQNIPETGRWLVIPAWIAALIKRSELRDTSLVGDTVSMLRNGRLGMIDRFSVYMSNLLPNPGVSTESYIYAGHSHGMTFASQLTKVETLRGESTFGTYLRGLQVYGRQVTDGTALAAAVVDAP